MNTFAILIDAGFVKARLGSADNPTTAEDIRALVQRICKHPTLAGQSLYRVYFYDAPPFAKTRLAPLNGGRRAFAQEPLTKHNLRLHQELKKMDYFALREGVQFALVTLGHKVHADLLEHSDFSLEITL